MSSGPPRRGDELKSYVLLAIAGSDDAFGEVVRLQQKQLVLLMTRVCGSRAAAEDVAQAAFLKAWRNLSTLRDAARFGPWLRQIAMRAAIDAVRSSESFDELHETSDGAGDAVNLRLDLDTALRQLSAAQRACVLLAYAEGLSHDEIAIELGLPIGTVKSHVARSVRVLRRVLSDMEV